MRIGIDASSQAVREKTGVAKYVQRLVEHLEQIDDENEYVIYYRLSRLKRRTYFYRPRKPTTKIKIFQEPLFTGRGIDVFHGPDARLPGVKGPRLVATILDVFSLISDSFASERFRKKKIARYADIAKRADRIICISENSRNDFVHFFFYSGSKIHVIYPGLDDHFFPRSEEEIARIRKKYGIHSDYILYVGDICTRKNILRMVRAFQHARKQGVGNLQFVLVGKGAYGEEEVLRYLNDSCCARDIVRTGYVPDEDLPILYSGAKLFLFTTLYEGFGFPILEALACGTPVITSNVSSMKEIAPEATCRVDPENEMEMAEAIADRVAHSDRYKQMVQTSIDIRSTYSWVKAAQQVIALYYECVNGP